MAVGFISGYFMFDVDGSLCLSRLVVRLVVFGMIDWCLLLPRRDVNNLSP